MNCWHTHSMYSVLDGLSSVESIVARAKGMGAKVAVITDHASISAMPELMAKSKEAGIKPVIGCEFYVADQVAGDNMKGMTRYHLSVWAKNWAGVESIMAQLTMANEQFYRRPLLTFDQALQFKDCMIGTACTFGILSHPEYQEIAGKFSAVYGDDLYLEIMPHRVVLDGETVDRQQVVNERAIELSSQNGWQLLATNDSHYTNKEDAETHKVLLAVQYGKTLAEFGGWGDGEGVFYMRTIPEMIEAFKALGYVPAEAISGSMVASVHMADKVCIELPKFDVHLPDVHVDDAGFAQRILADGWKEKINGKVGDQAKVYHARLIYELDVIKRMGFLKYFLMVDDIIRWSREQGIMVGPGRGSAAGSLVCYLMGITQLDPIKHGLYFERFLNPERVNLPDIDVDFQDDRRQEVFEYIVTKYGQECVGQINTFGVMTIKSAFRDVSRVHGINNMQVNILSKQIEDEESFDKVPELSAFAIANPAVIKFTKKLAGTIRQVGVHACGISISSRPLKEVCAVERRKDGVMVSCWDMRNCEKFGLLKMDILGLTTLSILEHARKLVRDGYGTDIVYTEIPLDDPKTMDMFSKGECAGVFQFEGAQMQELLRNLQANDFKTITATTALYRPGPLQAGLTDQFVKISQGRDYESYACPQLEPILSSTKSIMIYQEQIMRIFSDLGGFTWAQADQMRKIIGKKLGKDEFDKHRDNFVAGCEKNGIPVTVSDSLFSDMAEFASYSFNLAHAAAYTMISLWCMYLKAHYPSEFIAAYMSCVKSEDSQGNMVAEAKRLGVPVERPDINRSTDKYVLEDGKVLAPLGAIKGVGEKAVASILEGRKDGVFLSVEDMKARVYRRVVTVRVIDILERAGAFESLGVKEYNDEQREKNYAELLPMLNEVPALSLDRDPLEEEYFGAIIKQVDDLAAASGKKPLHAEHGTKPVIMAINMPVKGEVKLLKNRGTKLFQSSLADFGITMKSIYYTSVLKEVLDTPAKAPKKSLAAGLEIVKQEVVAVNPKLIICFATNAIPLFIPDGKIGKLNGKVVYNKTYDCYVMFSFSPQYAAYKTEEIGGMFEANMGKIYEMFGGGR